MIILIIILLLAVCMDLRTFKISNHIILAGYISGLLYQISLQIFHLNIQPFYLYPLSCIAILVILMPVFRLRVIGGGDVKLLSVCAMFTGFTRTVSIILYSLFAGAVISIFYLAYRQLLHSSYFNKSKNKQGKLVIHFSIPILIGVISEHIWGGIVWYM